VIGHTLVLSNKKENVEDNVKKRAPLTFLLFYI